MDMTYSRRASCGTQFSASHCTCKSTLTTWTPHKIPSWMRCWIRQPTEIFLNTHNSSGHNRHYASNRTTDFAYVFFCRTRTTRTGKCENILCLCDLLLGHVHRILVCIHLSHYTISQTETSSSHRPKKIPRQQKKSQANCVQPRNRTRRAPATEAEAQLQSEFLHCRALNPKLLFLDEKAGKKLRCSKKINCHPFFGGQFFISFTDFSGN